MGYDTVGVVATEVLDEGAKGEYFKLQVASPAREANHMHKRLPVSGFR